MGWVDAEVGKVGRFVYNTYHGFISMLKRMVLNMKETTHPRPHSISNMHILRPLHLLSRLPHLNAHPPPRPVRDRPFIFPMGTFQCGGLSFRESDGGGVSGGWRRGGEGWEGGGGGGGFVGVGGGIGG